jgi:hypothetical protein
VLGVEVGGVVALLEGVLAAVVDDGVVVVALGAVDEVLGVADIVLLGGGVVAGVLDAGVVALGVVDEGVVAAVFGLSVSLILPQISWAVTLVLSGLVADGVLAVVGGVVLGAGVALGGVVVAGVFEAVAAAPPLASMSFSFDCSSAISEFRSVNSF